MALRSQSDATAFDRLLQALEPEALSTNDKFRRCRSKLVRFFVWRHCEDPDNLADETTSRLVKNIQAGQEISAERPYSYVYAIASNVFLEHLRSKRKTGIQTDIDDLKDLTAPEKIDNCWTVCLAQLSADKREFLEEYYLDSIDREQFARDKGMTINALRLTIFRYKDALKRCVENCRRRLNSARN
jgi:DNA-directed RNA polymerase specialized sigma24 family protein